MTWDVFQKHQPCRPGPLHGTPGGLCGHPGGHARHHLYGDTITDQALKGKVVFLEYWGIHCQPCKASFPHLVAMRKKYAPSGRFTIFACHVQAMDPGVKAFLAENNVNFPVYQQPSGVRKAPCGSSIPAAYLIDHTGRIVAKGHPSARYNQIEAMVKAAPHPLLYVVTVKHCKSEARKLASGRGYASAPQSLAAKTRDGGDASGEAKILLDNLDAFLEGRLKNGKHLLDARPTQGVPLLQEFSMRAAS